MCVPRGRLGVHEPGDALLLSWYAGGCYGLQGQGAVRRSDGVAGVVAGEDQQGCDERHAFHGGLLLREVAAGQPVARLIPYGAGTRENGSPGAAGGLLPVRSAGESAAAAPILERRGDVAGSLPHIRRSSMDATAGDVTILLREWGAGSRDALDRLVPIVYDELRCLARARLRNEQARPLKTTELVHEAWLRLADLRSARFHDRAHFLAMAARMMRRLLVEHARARHALKRGGGAIAVTLDDVLAEEPIMDDAEAERIAALDAALVRLE